VRTEPVFDPRGTAMAGPAEGATFDLNTTALTLKGLTATDLAELRTQTFLVLARPN